MGIKHLARLAACAAVAAIAGGGGAWAGDPPRQSQWPNISEMTRGYTYYHRAGATIRDHDQDMVHCAAAAATTRSIDDQINNGAGNGLAGAIIGQAFGDAYNRATFYAALENCMVIHNWEVVRLPEAEAKAVIAAGNWAVREKVMEWVGQAEPHGVVVRRWGNDAATNTAKRFETRPGRTVNGSLSLIAIYEVPAERAASANLYDGGAMPRVKLDKRWPLKPLKPEAVSAAPDFTGVIILNIKGSVFGNGGALAFLRMADDGSNAPASLDGGPDYFPLVPRLGKSAGMVVAMALPPGRWRIASMGVMPAINFCFGSPAFEIKAGEVVYAGSFDMGAADMGPDLSLDLPRAWLGAQPAAERLRPAQYVNGYTGVCGGNALYALEVPGAPFIDGYHLGSAVQAGAVGMTPRPAGQPPAESR